LSFFIKMSQNMFIVGLLALLSVSGSVNTAAIEQKQSQQPAYTQQQTAVGQAYQVSTAPASQAPAPSTAYQAPPAAISHAPSTPYQAPAAPAAPASSAPPAYQATTQVAKDTVQLTTVAYQPTKEVVKIVENWGSCVPTPVLQKPKEVKPVIIQNNGFCLRTKKVESRLEVFMEAVQDALKELQSAWVVLEDGRLMSKEHNNHCLSRSPTGMTVQPCEHKDTIMWDIDYKRGVFQDKSNNKCLNMADGGKTLNFIDVPANPIAGATNYWSIFQMDLQEHISPMRQLESLPKSFDPFALIYGDLHLVVDLLKEQTAQHVSLTCTKQPQAIQKQNWVIREDGSMMNLVHKQCLGRVNANSDDLTLCDCSLPTALKWDFKVTEGLLVNKESNKYMQVKDDKPVLVDYSSGTQQPLKWQAMQMKASQGNNNSTQLTGVSGASASFPTLIGATLFSVSAYMVQL
jgi:type II secretory pathway pseudopilin PulG